MTRSGLSTKVHLIVDALGAPLFFEVSEGQRHDCKFAVALLVRAKSRCLLADKAYDSNEIRDALAQQSALAVIPPKADRAKRIVYDKHLYKSRADVECTFSLLKQARRFATRYEKTLRNYVSVVALSCALIWLRI